MHKIYIIVVKMLVGRTLILKSQVGKHAQDRNGWKSLTYPELEDIDEVLVILYNYRHLIHLKIK